MRRETRRKLIIQQRFFNLQTKPSNKSVWLCGPTFNECQRLVVSQCALNDVKNIFKTIFLLRLTAVSQQ